MIPQALPVPLESVTLEDFDVSAAMGAFKDAQRAKRFRTRRPKTVTSEKMVPTELGEGKFRKAHLIGWARRMLERGFYVARFGWNVDEHPKRLFLWLDGTHLRLRYEDGETEEFACFTWADVHGDDWYLVEQLEIVR